MKVLLVEDETKIAKYVSQGLKEEGHVVELAQDGEEGLQKASNIFFDLVILDLNLPKLDGLSLCRQLRNQKIKSLIIMLTARDTTDNKIEGLDAGADDYLTKPFSFNELLARIRALDRRRQDQPSTQIEIKDLKINPLTRKVQYKNKTIELTGKEFSLLQYLVRRKGHLLTRTAIAEAVWGYDFDSSSNVIDVTINHLRKKLKEPSQKDWIQTRRHQGYVFDVAEDH